MKFSVFLATVLVAFSGPIYASPLTYNFDIPTTSSSYYYPLGSSATSLFGSEIKFAFTVDNSQSSDLSQSYNFTNILSIVATSIDGTYNQTFLGNPNPSTAPITSVPFITTDSSGIPTLLLGYQPTLPSGFENTYNNQSIAGGYYIYMSQTTNGAVSTALSLTGPTNPYTAAQWNTVNTTTGLEAPFDIVGTAPQVSPVPITSSLILTLTGLGLLGLAMRMGRN